MPSMRSGRVCSGHPLIAASLLAILGCVGCGRSSKESAIEISRAVTIAPWTAGVSYTLGALVTFNGVTFRCRQAHTSQVGWEPPNAPALWERPGAAGINPWTNQTAYVIGSGVTFDGLVYRCIQAHTSQPDWTPPATPTLWKLTANVQIPPGLSGSLAFVWKSRNLPTGVTDGFGLVQRDPFGDPSFTELLDTKQRSVGEVFHRVRVQGGEIFELYLQANKTKATSTPSMTPATYSSDPTMNTVADPTTPDHVAQPLQDASQLTNHIWSLRWESFNFADPGRDGRFDDLTVELRLEAPCDNVQVACTDPNLVVSSHNATKVDYRGDLSVPVAGPVPGVAAGPVRDASGGEGSVIPIGSTAFVGARVDTLRWSFVQESTDFSAATPPETIPASEFSPPGATQLGGGLWSLQIARIHRPRAEGLVSSFGPAVFSNFDAKLTLQAGGIGNQNTVVLFDPKSDAPPVTFFELSQQDGDTAVDGRYHDNATRMYASLTLFNASGGVEPNLSLAKTAIVTRQTGEQLKFEIIKVQSSGATQFQGRLTTIQDRNGNGMTVTYQFAASSTDSQLGGDRNKLWLINKVTDPHGVAATFNYQLRTGTSRWVVTSISLPDATTTQYQYGTDANNLDRLVKVVHANGDASNFSRAWDAATESWALSFQDAVGSDVRSWKTVYVTGTTFTTADNVVHNQEPNLVRRIVNNDGEQVYKATEDPNDPNTTFFREGANRITRLTIDVTGLPRQVARATTISPDPTLASYAVVESYEGDVVGMIQRATDGFGNVRSFLRDSKTRGITGVTARGGTAASFTLNSFLQPTRTVDRIGRTTTVSYDSKGNPLTITHAVGTAVQAAWAYVYNARGQVTKATDANGKATDYAYNGTGFLTSITEPADVSGGTRAVRTFEFSSVGRLSASIDAAARRVTFAYDSRGRLTTATFPDGTRETQTYGSGATAGLVASKSDRNGHVEQYQYDPTRRLAEVTRATGRPEQIGMSFEYLAGTDLTSVQTNAGERVELMYDERQRLVARSAFVRGDVALTSQRSWDALDRPISDTDPYGRRALRVFDVNGRAVRTVTELVPGGVPAGADPTTLPRVTSPNPPYVVEDGAYDAMNQYRSTIDGRGVITSMSYDAQGRRSSLIQAAGAPEARKTTFAYDLVGNLTTETEPRTFTEGQTFQRAFTYTARNLVASKTDAAGSADAATFRYTYSATGKTLTMIDPRGSVTTYGYDACCDRLVSVQDPALFATIYTNDAVGNRVTMTNPLGATTSYSYDGLNRLTRQTDPLGHATSYVYDDDLTDGFGLDPIYGDFTGSLGFGPNANGSAVQVTNAANETTATIRDGAGRVVVTVSASGNPTTTAYDAVVGGLVETAVTDPIGNVTRRREDGVGATHTLIDAAVKTTTRTFDASRNLISERDPNGVGHDCVYDGLGQRTTCTDTQGDKTTWEYDAAGNQTAVTTGSTTDGTLARKTTTFDFRNRRMSYTDGVSATTRWAYDANSNVTTITDGESRVTTYTYESRNLRVTETFPDSAGPTDHVTNSYDGAGRLATRTDQGGNTMTYGYDAADRLRTKTDAEAKVDTLNYDPVGRFSGGTSQRYGTTVSRTYDFGGRLQTETLTTPSPQTTTFTVAQGYDSADRRSTLTYPDGSTVTSDYTNRSQLNTIKLGTQLIAQYGYDNGARQQTATLGNGLVETRAYRNDNTLSSISTPEVGTFTYTYDAVKRRKTEGGTAVNGPQTLGYDNEGRLTNWGNGTSTQSWSLSPVGDWNTTTRDSVLETRVHDAAHEVTSVNGTSASYDARGNMVEDPFGDGLTWDFENHLTSFITDGGAGASYLYDVLGRKVERIAGGHTTVFVHSREEVVAEYVDSGLQAKYILGPGIDKPVAFVDGAMAVSWYHANHLGTTGAATNGAGVILERYRYDAYGGRTVLDPGGSPRLSSVLGNQIGFTGRYHDAATGLVDFRFREFDTRLGRFASRDDNYRDGMSRYGAYFVPNRTDPKGHCSSLVAEWTDSRIVMATEGCLSPVVAVRRAAGTIAVLPPRPFDQSGRCPQFSGAAGYHAALAIQSGARLSGPPLDPDQGEKIRAQQVAGILAGVDTGTGVSTLAPIYEIKAPRAAPPPTPPPAGGAPTQVPIPIPTPIPIPFPPGIPLPPVFPAPGSGKGKNYDRCESAAKSDDPEDWEDECWKLRDILPSGQQGAAIRNCLDCKYKNEECKMGICRNFYDPSYT